MSFKYSLKIYTLYIYSACAYFLLSTIAMNFINNFKNPCSLIKLNFFYA